MAAAHGVEIGAGPGILLGTGRADPVDLMAARIDQMNMWMWGNADPKKRGPQPEPLPRPGNGSGHAVANPSKPENSGEATRRTRTIKPMALTIEQLDAFMSRDFTDV